MPSLGEKTVLDGCAGQRGGIWPVVSSGLEQGSRVVLCCDLIIHRRLCTSQRAGVVKADLLSSLSLLTVLWCKQELTPQFYRWKLWCPEKCGELTKVTW